jgi:hypothetical protein
LRSDKEAIHGSPLWTEKAVSVGRASGYRHQGWLSRDEQAACEVAFFEALCG